jgi:MYXO-CTERM domain-containing protein
MKNVCLFTLVALAGVANAALTDTRVDLVSSGATVDGTLSANEYGPGNSYVYRGAGSGFGGTLGNGAIYFKSDATNLYIGYQAGGNLDNNVVLELDTKAGGFTDATMHDGADGGRRGASDLAKSADDAFPSGFLADYAIIIGNFGIVSFELTGGSVDNSLNFLTYSGQFTGNGQNVREFSIPLATIGSGSNGNIDFFAALISDSGYASNESIPASPALQANGNPGFGDGQFGGTTGTPGYANFDRFTTVPTPGALALLGLGGLVTGRRRR